MAVTVGEVARAALADVAERGAGIANGIRWVNERISDLDVRRLKHRRRIGSLVLPAAITAGTVSVTNGAETVTPDATALAAWAKKSFAGWFIQFGSDATWYRVLSSSASVLTLDQAYQGTTDADATYHLAQRYVTLKPDVQFLGEKMSLERTGTVLTLKSQAQLDLMVPGRDWDPSFPRYFSEFSEEGGKKVLEFYPYSTRDEHVLCVYWEAPGTLTSEDIVPSCFSQRDLKIGVLADIYSYQAAKASTDGKVDLANRLSNLAARQETLWERAKQNIYRRTRATEDLVLLFGTRSQSTTALNYNAHTEVALRGR